MLHLTGAGHRQIGNWKYFGKKTDTRDINLLIREGMTCIRFKINTRDLWQG